MQCDVKLSDSWKTLLSGCPLIFDLQSEC